MLIKNIPKKTFANCNENPSYAEADVALLGVACDISCTYGKGAWLGPQAMLDASFQLEPEVPIFHSDFSEAIRIHNQGILEYPREVAKAKRKHFEFSETKRIMEEMVSDVQAYAQRALEESKLLFTVGGDHSISSGVFNAIAEKFEPETVTVLHLDAHLDLREAYQALEYSHASTMFNVYKKGFPSLHVGIRDHISEEEAAFILENKLQKNIYFAASQPSRFYEDFASKSKIFVKENMIYKGFTPEQIKQITSQIRTKYVYITLDLDVLDPVHMPSTGTPAPNGLSLQTVQNVLYNVIRQSQKQKSQFLGFDITELAPMINRKAITYKVEDTLSTINEVNASALAYRMLFWHYIERFLEK
jgi:agmatinase